ncbi:MAG TPA: septum formation family protein [Acidimicrobiales bacterium]
MSLVLAGITAIPALIVAGRAKRRRGSGSGLITAARVVAVISLAAWLTVAGVVVASLAKPDGVDYAELEAGDCIDTPEGTEVRRLKVKACDKPHDAEVFAVISHPAGPGEAFPGAGALLEYAAYNCLGQPFTDYVGIPRGQSQLTEFEIVPESEAWAEGRRGLVCAVDNADRSPLTASVRGSAK